jgi:hypothetical protein
MDWSGRALALPAADGEADQDKVRAINERPLCTTANDPAEMSKWVIHVVLGALADVRSSPVSYRNSDSRYPLRLPLCRINRRRRPPGRAKIRHQR